MQNAAGDDEAMKRGPKVGDFYHVTGSHKITRDLDDLARRRTAAFLDSVGVESRPLSHILREAWLQGVKTSAACGKEI